MDKNILQIWKNNLFEIDRNMYGEVDSKEIIKKGEGIIARDGISMPERASITKLKSIIYNFNGDLEMKRILKKIVSGVSSEEELLPLEEEVRLSDNIEKFLGKDTYIKIFFSEKEIITLSSAEEKYKVIKESKNPKVIALQDELNPDKIYKAFKYKPRIKSFNEEGVRKMLENPEISKSEKKFLAFNLDKVQDNGTIQLNYKELIYNRFIKEEE